MYKANRCFWLCGCYRSGLRVLIQAYTFNNSKVTNDDTAAVPPTSLPLLLSSTCYEEKAESWVHAMGNTCCTIFLNLFRNWSTETEFILSFRHKFTSDTENLQQKTNIHSNGVVTCKLYNYTTSM